MIGRSLSTAPSDGGFYMELTGPFTELEREDAGGGRCLA